MLYIKSENKVCHIEVEGTGQEITNDVINALDQIARNFGKEGGEDKGTAFAATLMVAMDMVWSKRRGYASMKETAKELVGVADIGIIAEDAGVKA